MKNAITTLRIQNFKSIKDVEIKPRRVNLILGEPNVGKSNVLEAISLLGGAVYDQTSKFMAGMIRYELISQLYYDNIRANVILIESNKGSSMIRSGKSIIDNMFLYMSFETISSLKNKAERYHYSSNPENIWNGAFNEVIRTGKIGDMYDGDNYVFGFRDIKDDGTNSSDSPGLEKKTSDLAKEINIRSYIFNKMSAVGQKLGVRFLYPPNGVNLKSIIQLHPELRKEVADMFRRYGLKLSLRMVSDELEVIKEIDELIYSYPYSSIADTLQRLIFYLAAIESNDDAVLLFEEPEAHSFPTYVSQLGRRIVDSENNQFFIVTHSPYLVTEILEEMVPNDEMLSQLAIFVAYYEDYQTKIRQLTDDEMRTVRANGTEMFYNLRQFTPAGQE